MPRQTFADRRASGRLLGAQLIPLGLRNPAVIALCPGGIHVGFEVARALRGELDLIAIQDDGSDSWQLDTSSVDMLHRMVVIVDDGSTSVSAILDSVAAIRLQGATRITLAVPVLLGSALPVLQSACDAVLYLVQTSSGEQAGDRYADFHDVGRGEAIRLLRNARNPRSPPAPPVREAAAAPDEAKSAMRGAAVLLVEQDSFLAEYIKVTLHAAGASIVGPFRSAKDVQAYSRGRNVPADVAAIDVDIPGGAAAAARSLSRLNIPFVLVGASDPLWSAPMLRGRPFLPSPFAAFQLVDALGQVLLASRARVERR